MAEIISTRKVGEKMLLELEATRKEVEILKGNMSAIHLFCEMIPGYSINVSRRGSGRLSNYFLIPKQLRKNISHKQVKCQEISLDGKRWIIYETDLMDKRTLRKNGV